MTALGWVPRASVWPWARCVEAKTSPSSSAWQTPTSVASWPSETWRKPGSSPARNCSSTFSSNRRMINICRRKSRSCSSERADFAAETLGFFSTFAIGSQFMLHRVSLVNQWRRIEAELSPDWDDARLGLALADERQGGRAASLLGPANPGRRGNEIRFFCARRGAGPSPGTIGRLLGRLDAEGVGGELRLLASGE